MVSASLSEEVLEKRRGNPWWLSIAMVICGAGFAIWFSVASLTPHTWVVPNYSELSAVVGRFSPPSWKAKNPYGFLRADGTPLRLSCYPEVSENDCLTNSISLAGRLVTVRHFVVHPREPLIQWLYGTTSDILMEVQVGTVTPLSYRQSVERLQHWSMVEERQKIELLPIGLAISIFIAAIGALSIYWKLILGG